MSTANSLPYYTPALGNRYFQPVPKAREASSTQASRESTPMPDAAAAIPTELATKAPASTATSSTMNVADTQALYESFGQFLRFGKEYMDENPLIGEPGSFVFTSSKQHLQAQHDMAAKKAAQQVASKLQTEIRPSPFPEPSRQATPQIKTDVPNTGKRTKSPGAGAGGQRKPKRRKSKVAKSPRSPGSAISLG